MAVYKDEIFDDTPQHIDGNTYEDCIFNGTQLIYSGGLVPTMEGCTFNNPDLVFEGPAGDTLKFMQGMSRPRSGLQEVVRRALRPMFIN